MILPLRDLTHVALVNSRSVS